MPSRRCRQPRNPHPPSLDQVPSLLNVQDAGGRTAAYCAASEGKGSLLFLLVVSHKADVSLTAHGTEYHNWTCLHAAAFSGHNFLVDTLLSVPEMDIEAVDDAGNTALDLAEAHRHGVVAFSIGRAKRKREQADRARRRWARGGRLARALGGAGRA